MLEGLASSKHETKSLPLEHRQVLLHPKQPGTFKNKSALTTTKVQEARTRAGLNDKILLLHKIHLLHKATPSRVGKVTVSPKTWKQTQSQVIMRKQRNISLHPCMQSPIPTPLPKWQSLFPPVSHGLVNLSLSSGESQSVKKDLLKIERLCWVK